MSSNEKPRGRHAAASGASHPANASQSNEQENRSRNHRHSNKESESFSKRPVQNQGAENPFADQGFQFDAAEEVETHGFSSRANRDGSQSFNEANPFEKQDLFFDDDSASSGTNSNDSFFGDFSFLDENDSAANNAVASNDVTHSGNRVRVRKRVEGSKRKKSKAKPILLGILVAVLMLIGAGVGYAAWYGKALNNALAPDQEELDAINDATTEAQEGQPFYTLLMVSDSREGTDGVDPSEASERSDVILLLRVDPANRVLTMVSVPRDTPYTFPDGSVKKLNETYNQGGAAMTIQAVEEITGVKISHYAEMNFSDVEAMVNDLGGIEVNVDTPISGTDSYSGETVTLDAGTQTLDGAQAKVYLQTRKVYEDDQDMHRQQNVRNFVQAVMKKVLSKPLNEIPDTILDIAQYISTDMTVNDLVKLAQDFAGGNVTVYSCTGPDKGEINEDAGGLWLCYDNPAGWKKLMTAVDAGEDPSGIDVNAK